MKKFAEILKESPEVIEEKVDNVSYIRMIRTKLTDAALDLDKGKDEKSFDMDTKAAFVKATKLVDQARKILFDVQ